MNRANGSTVSECRALASLLREHEAHGLAGSVRLDVPHLCDLLHAAADAIDGVSDLARHRARPRSRDVDAEYWRRWCRDHVGA